MGLAVKLCMVCQQKLSFRRISAQPLNPEQYLFCCGIWCSLLTVLLFQFCVYVLGAHEGWSSLMLHLICIWKLKICCDGAPRSKIATGFLRCFLFWSTSCSFLKIYPNPPAAEVKSTKWKWKSLPIPAIWFLREKLFPNWAHAFRSSVWALVQLWSLCNWTFHQNYLRHWIAVIFR